VQPGAGAQFGVLRKRGVKTCWVVVCPDLAHRDLYGYRAVFFVAVAAEGTMEYSSTAFRLQRHIVWLGVGLMLGCSERPTAPDAPRFEVITVTDPATVLFVDGVTVSRQLTIRGTVAGIVVTVDTANLNLSKATVDCNNQNTSVPSIGVWIQGDRTRVHVQGGGTGVVRNCATGVLIGQFDPSNGDPGGSENYVSGLVIQNSFGGGCFYCGFAIAVSNSHDNFAADNSISEASEGGIFVFGSDHTASAAGGNKIFDNIIAGNGDLGITVSSDANEVRGNQTMGWFFGVVVDQDNNLIGNNQMLPNQGGGCGCVGLQLQEGADGNLITGNKVVTNAEFPGFLVEVNTFRNLIRENTATSTGTGLDAVDKSGGCVNNTWTNNNFTTKDPACIQ
jgi:copper-binding protein NosD